MKAQLIAWMLGGMVVSAALAQQTATLSTAGAADGSHPYTP